MELNRASRKLQYACLDFLRRHMPLAYLAPDARPPTGTRFPRSPADLDQRALPQLLREQVGMRILLIRLPAMAHDRYAFRPLVLGSAFPGSGFSGTGSL
jgi:hypothetical protein